ncbi:MAG: hypothetical protein JSS57_09480 [Proteobacteria bacterium]|nr:hypothetical protein [Pseudomonadota bacterium]
MNTNLNTLHTEHHMHKLSCQSGNAWIAHSHPATFRTEIISGGSERLVAGVPAGDVTIFKRLVESIEAPYFLLYVLHTPRGEGQAGRYQSPSIGLDELESFLERYAAFLSGDARFDIWAYSPSENATVIWDRHDLIYAYGATKRFAMALRELGFEQGAPGIRFPHQHHYRAEFDADASDVLHAFEWCYSPLHPEDEQ